jgi:hypothetical protein
MESFNGKPQANVNLDATDCGLPFNEIANRER